MSPERAHSVGFVSSKYDDPVAFKDEAAKEIKQLFTTVDEISVLCDRIAKSIDALEAYTVTSLTLKLKVCQLQRKMKPPTKLEIGEPRRVTASRLP